MRIFMTLMALFTLGSMSSCASLGWGGRADPYAGLSPHARRVAMAIDQRDLVLGMSRDHVQAVWGTPIEVESAGEETQGNQRWIYSDRLQNPAFRDFGRERVVYFENGRVIGWEQN